MAANDEHVMALERLRDNTAWVDEESTAAIDAAITALSAAAGAAGDQKVPMSEWMEAQHELNELRAELARLSAAPPAEPVGCEVAAYEQRVAYENGTHTKTLFYTCRPKLTGPAKRETYRALVYRTAPVQSAVTEEMVQRAFDAFCNACMPYDENTELEIMRIAIEAALRPAERGTKDENHD